MAVSLVMVALLCFWPGTGQGGSLGAPAVTEYHLEVAFDLPQAKIMGRAKIHGTPGRKLVIHLGDLQVKSISGIPHQLDLKRLPDPLELVPPAGTVEIVYEGSFSDPEENIIAAEEIILRNIWYPLVEGLSRYRLTATLPQNYLALSEADHIQRTEKDNQAIYTFDFPYPLNDMDGLTFAASHRYRVSQGSYRDIAIYTYLFAEDAHLAATFLEHACRYLKMFEDRLGKYPYRRLAIVESSHPGSYSMPTYVLLSQKDIQAGQRAEMERTALGHEILHQWFGNSVFTDHDQGNWNEGATIYFADHFYCEQKGADWRCRRRILSGIQSHVTAQKDFPLRLFSERADFSSRSIGYGKAALVFHMLRRLVGEEAFFAAIRDFVRENTFRVASWDEIRTAMEKRSGQNLACFFRHWLDGTGLPEVRLERPTVKQVGQKFEVSFTLKQAHQAIRLLVPVTVYWRNGSQKHWVTLTRPQERFTLTLNARPEELVIDEAFDVFRRLTEKENPPTFERLASEIILVVPPEVGIASYAPLLEYLQEEDYTIKLASYQEVLGGTGTASVLLLGRDHPLIERLLGKIDLPASDFCLTIRNHPHRPSSLIGILHCSPGINGGALLKEVLAYPFYSNYWLADDHTLSRSLEEPQRGIRVRLAKMTLKNK